jgi:putative transposase
MPNSHTEVYVHYVWTTHDRKPHLAPEIETRLYNCIRGRCGKMQAHLLAVGGAADHIHLLIRQPATLSMGEVANDIKGASSHFATHALACAEFGWQRCYYAISVGPDAVDSVVRYIENQKRHHANNALRAGWEPVADDRV